MKLHRATQAVLRLAAALFVTSAVASGNATAQPAQGINLVECKGLWFSTSEDFTAGVRLPGGPVVSDGDLLTFESGGSRLCARNADLLRRFDIVREDHGLDALDQVALGPDFVMAAFSTELDSVHGQFSAGDLLFTNGLIIPNAALLARFDVVRGWDMGLDAVHIVGEPERIRALIERLMEVGPGQLRQQPELLIELLRATGTDIWFSTEGTAPVVQSPGFIDGDLLSARDGTIVRSNNALLPALPAGIPQEGVDYGLDAFTPEYDQIEGVPVELLSTEIQARDRTFSDGDALQTGPSVWLSSSSLTATFEPRDTDFGLDALGAMAVKNGDCEFRITTVSDIPVVDINQATGLFDTDRPFGDWVRIQGIVPGSACPEYNTHEFQVRVAVDGGPEVPILHPASLNWRRNVAPCVASNDLYTSDPGGGWFTLTNYWRFNECPDDASLAFWNSNTAPGAKMAVFRIAMRPIGGGPETFSTPIRIRIDNEPPEELVAELYYAGADEPFGDQCKIEFAGEDIVIDIKGRARDEHFREYQLYWTGGDVHTWRLIPATVDRFYNAGRPDLGTNGTEPPAATDVPLGTLNLTTEYAAATGGMPVIDCGYTVRLRAWDRSFLGIFTPSLNAYGHQNGNWSDYMQSFCLDPGTEGEDDIGLVGPEIRGESLVGQIDPVRTEGAPYEPAEPIDWASFIPNEEHLNIPPIPEGPQRGDLEPNNPEILVQSDGDEPSQSIDFDEYSEVDDVLPNLSSLGEVSVAENGDTVIMTGNTWMALSEDAGGTFTYINPTTIFPQSNGGLCCDQVVMFVPQYDLFVWLMQYRSSTGSDGTRDNRIRVAVQSTEAVRSSNGTSWTYWDFPSNVFSANGSLDYNDMTATTENIYWTSMIAGGRIVVRLPLDELVERTTVHYRYTGGTNAVFSHITQNARNEVYWAGHVDTSQLRVYNWPDGDNSYYWRTVNINSWPNGSESSITPSGVDWMDWETNITTYVYGNALEGSSVWFAWQAGSGGGFPNPHVQMVRLNASTFAFEEQVQIWNPDFAFQDAFLSTNSGGELGMSVAFGGGPYHASHAVGVWGDFVVYYPALSTRSVTRWGDYNTSRRSGSNPRQWVAGGYTLTTDGSGNNITVPHYIRFSR